jgi:hypothetical protein
MNRKIALKRRCEVHQSAEGDNLERAERLSAERAMGGKALEIS